VVSNQPAPEWDGPPRPFDTWRVCGKPTELECTCTEDPWGPSQTTVIAALKRLRGEIDGQ
jgi:hypothetical protein